MQFPPATSLERKMQPEDQAIIAFIVAVFVIFSAAMAYASSLSARQDRDSSRKNNREK